MVWHHPFEGMPDVEREAAYAETAVIFRRLIDVLGWDAVFEFGVAAKVIYIARRDFEKELECVAENSSG